MWNNFLKFIYLFSTALGLVATLGLSLHCSGWVSHCGGFSCRGAPALELLGFSESVSSSVMSDSAIPWTAAQQAPLSIRILQARILEWVAIPFSRGSSQHRDWTQVSCTPGRSFTVWATRASVVVTRGSVVAAHRLSCPAACGFFPDQEWNPCPLNWQMDSQPLDYQGSP